MIEHLEPRRLMSANLQDNGVMVVTGTDAGDRVSLHRRGDRLVLIENNARTSYDAAAATVVMIQVGHGDNRVVLGRNLTQRINVSAGDGDDVLVGTDRDDYLSGGNGNNRLVGRGGDDRLGGGNGNDRLDGGRGDDALTGGGGTDRLIGGPGVDHGHSVGGATALSSVENRVFADVPVADGLDFLTGGGISTAIGPDGEVTANVSFMLRVHYEVSHDPPRAEDDRIISTLRTLLNPDYDPSVPQPAVYASGATHTVGLGRLAPGRYTFVLEHEGRAVAEADFRVGR